MYQQVSLHHPFQLDVLKPHTEADVITANNSGLCSLQGSEIRNKRIDKSRLCQVYS
jgi:hypothetical protein